MYSPNPKAKRLEFRCPDPSCNPYLSFSAILMAMIDGIQNKIDPGEPLDKDIYDLSPEELGKSRSARLAGARPWRRLARRSRLPAPRRRLHPGRDRHLDQVQDDQRGAGDAVAAASLRVLPVLRHSSTPGAGDWGLDLHAHGLRPMGKEAVTVPPSPGCETASGRSRRGLMPRWDRRAARPIHPCA